MFDLLGSIFGSPKAVTGVVESVTSGIDALVYTDEEKATDAAKERAAARGMLVQWMDTTKGQNLARRFLAMIITGVWLFQYIASMGLDVAAIFVSNPDALARSSVVIGDRADGMTGAMMLILGFYFAAPHMGRIAETALLKFGGDKTTQTRKEAR